MRRQRWGLQLLSKGRRLLFVVPISFDFRTRGSSLSASYFFLGKRCQNDLNDCIYQNGSKKCIHGDCEDKIAAFKCTCDVGWRGTLCDLDINECYLDYCRNNASCNNTQGSYICTCPEGYTGRNCSTDIDDCVNVTCSHNETCVDEVSLYKLLSLMAVTFLVNSW